MTATTAQELAINGGKPVRTAAWPARHLFGEEEKQAAVALFDKAIQTGGVIGYNGEDEEAYCKEFAAYLGGGFADGVNSGTTALFVALLALRLEPFTEVITPPITDPGGAMPVAMLNCIPVPADCAPGSYNAGAEQIAARITPRTSAIITAHISGHPSDLDAIAALAKKHKLPLIEDCAQSHGALYKGKFAGTIGDIAAFSTMSGKHHCTGPQGGVVFTKNEALAKVVRRASDRGKPFHLNNAAGNVIASLNLNSNDLAAAIGRVQLKKLPGILAGRRKAARLLADGCQKIRGIKLNTGLPDTESAYWFLTFRIDLSQFTVDKNTIVKALNAEGIPMGGSYYHAPSEHPWFVERNVFGTSGLPWSSPSYKGDAKAVYPLPNARATDDAHITMSFHERVGELEVADALAAMKKVTTAYAK